MNRIALALLLITSCLASQAQDRSFARVYQSNVLPLGVSELEYWNTLRSGREEFYNRIDQRLELELGLGHNVQTSFYLNFKTEAAYVADAGEIVKNHGIGFSNEWKFKLSDPVANTVGSALYAEAGFDGDEIELEGKLILDKKINNHLFAFNLTDELEIEFSAEGDEGVETETENNVNVDLGYLLLAGKNKRNGIGLEVTAYNRFAEGEWEYSAWFAGPTVHFSGERWFINFNIMPQLFNAKDTGNSEGSLELHDHEKVEARVLLSFTL
jgi:hypothetical protein